MNTLREQDIDASPEVIARASKIRLALFDVDGVLTDGGLYFSAEGEELKLFNVLDGHGLKMLIEGGVSVGVVTARDSAAVSLRMQELGIRHFFPGRDDKAAVFDSLLDELELDDEQCSYMGDDLPDLPVMRRCGLALAAQNAHPVVRQLSDWVVPAAGGSGAVRRVCDLILFSQGKLDRVVTDYLSRGSASRK